MVREAGGVVSWEIRLAPLHQQMSAFIEKHRQLELCYMQDIMEHLQLWKQMKVKEEPSRDRTDPSCLDDVASIVWVGEYVCSL